MRVIHPNAVGIDIGADFIFIAVEDQAVVSFETFTDALHQARDYLLAHHIETVAMEATGIYWLPLYEILEAAGLEVFLVNGAPVKNVPGGKSDVLDCQRQILNRKRGEVIRSLADSYQAEHLFALEQALAAWRFYQQQIQQFGFF